MLRTFLPFAHSPSTSWDKAPGESALSENLQGRRTHHAAKRASPFGKPTWSECYFAHHTVNQNQPVCNASLVLTLPHTPSQTGHVRRRNRVSFVFHNSSCHHLGLIHSSVTPASYSLAPSLPQHPTRQGTLGEHKTPVKASL